METSAARLDAARETRNLEIDPRRPVRALRAESRQARGPAEITQKAAADKGTWTIVAMGILLSWCPEGSLRKVR
jgi:hypothetical protein